MQYAPGLSKQEHPHRAVRPEVRRAADAHESDARRGPEEERARALKPRRHVRAVVAAPRAGAEELGARSRNAKSGSYLGFLGAPISRLITRRPNQKLPEE